MLFCLRKNEALKKEKEKKKRENSSEFFLISLHKSQQR